MRRTVTVIALALAFACGVSEPAAPPPAAEAPPPEPDAHPTERTPAQMARDAELAKKVAGTLDTYRNEIYGFGGALSHDNKTILFGSTRDGTPELYAGMVAQPSAAPVAVTRGPERVLSASLTRDGRAVLFTRDKGADENTHIFRVGMDGSGLVDLTPDAGVRNDPPVLPPERPDVMLYTRRKVSSPASTVLMQPIAGGEARVVYEDPGPVFLADASPDAKRALLVRVRSASDLTLLELDVAAGKTRRVHPPEGKTEAVAAAAYAPDGQTIFVSTDQGGESSVLLALDARGVVRARWTPNPATAMVDQVIAAPKGGLVAVRVNAGNRTELRLLDARTLAERSRPKLPVGSVTLGELTPDGSRLTLSLSAPDEPGEPYAVNTRTGAARILREDARPRPSTPIEVVLTSTPAFDGKPIPIHAYLPKTRGSDKLPVIVWFHGGPSASSEIHWSAPIQFFSEEGYAWVEPNIRGSTGFGRAWEMADNREKRGDVLEDMKSVNAWIRAQPWADGERIALFGGSYGGWVVLMGLTRQQSLWKVGVDLVGVADLRSLLASTDQLVRALLIDEFGDLDEDQELLAAWSPLKDADAIVAPLFVYQGANDPRVPRIESDAIVRALRRNGRPVEYMIAADEGHSLDRRENRIEFWSRSARFLEEHLR